MKPNVVPTAMNRGLLLPLLLAATFATSQTPAAKVASSAQFRIDDLGELATIADDVAVSLNEAGEIAFWTRTDGLVRATVWKDGRAMPIELVAGYPNSIAHGIDRDGDVAGWMNTSGNLVDSRSTTVGFVRRAGKTSLVAGLGGLDSRAYALNAAGTVVGTATLPDGSRHAFATRGDVALDLGTLPGGSSSAAYAINDAGQIAGVADTHGGKNHAVSWADGHIVDLGTVEHGGVSSARAINAKGEIVGFSDTPEGFHAFLYRDGKMLDLGTLGSEPSAASGINGGGEVVGASNISGTQRRAFLWRGGTMIDLNTLIPAASGYTLLNAFSINDRGQIACSGRRKGESVHLLLLSPKA